MDIVTNSSRKDAPSLLVMAVLRIGSWVIRFTFSFQFSSLRAAAFAEPLASSIQYILLVIRLEIRTDRRGPQNC